MNGNRRQKDRKNHNRVKASKAAYFSSIQKRAAMFLDACPFACSCHSMWEKKVTT